MEGVDASWPVTARLFLFYFIFLFQTPLSPRPSDHQSHKRATPEEQKVNPGCGITHHLAADHHRGASHLSHSRRLHTLLTKDLNLIPQEVHRPPPPPCTSSLQHSFPSGDPETGPWPEPDWPRMIRLSQPGQECGLCPRKHQSRPCGRRVPPQHFFFVSFIIHYFNFAGKLLHSRCSV